MTADIKIYIASGILLIIGIFAGFFLVRNNVSPELTSTAIKKMPSDFYTSQSASITGQIVKVGDKTAIVRNLKFQTEAEFTVSEKLVVSGLRGVESENNFLKLQAGREALIQLEMVGDRYEIVSLQYINPPPSLPPSSIAKPSNPNKGKI